ncbi:MAG: phosphorylase family protein [Promethearchaeota archaeon]
MSIFDEVKTKLINIGLQFMTVDEKIIRATLETSPKNVKKIVILPAISSVMKSIVGELKNKTKEGIVYNGDLNGVEVSVIKTEMGSPATAVIMECLKRIHVKVAIRVDYCGALQTTYDTSLLERMTNLCLSNDIKRAYLNPNEIIRTNLSIGDIIIPKTALLSDGTSYQYLQMYKNEVLYSDAFKKYVSLSKFQKSRSTSAIRAMDGKMIVDVKNNCMNYPSFKDHFWSIDADSEIYNIVEQKRRQLFPSQPRILNGDRIFGIDALFCEPQEAINTWRLYGCNSIDMESSILYLLGNLFFIKTVSILAISDLPDNDEYNYQKSNKIHPNFFKGINKAIKILKESLPEIKNIIK